jgi:hypothetical protein
LDWFRDKNTSDPKLILLAVQFGFGWLIKKYDPIRFNFVRFNLDQFLDIQITNIFLTKS